MSRVEELLGGVVNELANLVDVMGRIEAHLSILGQVALLQTPSVNGLRTIDQGEARPDSFVSYIDDEEIAKREADEGAHIAKWGIPVPDYSDPGDPPDAY